MKPSFLSLFKRGRYLSALDEGDDTNEAKKRREERERFAVAALAFCLRHDEVFRKHFWEKICRVPDDLDQMPLITPDGVAIEPPEWADLSLTSDDGKCRFVWVIEAKAGASLQLKQNPTKKEFLKDTEGYGALLAAHEAPNRARLRYIVLGASESLGIRDGQKVKEIFVQERNWGHLLDGMSREGITGDLIKTFTQLRIGEFFMEKAKSIVVTGGIQDAVNASTLLVGICAHFGIRNSRLRLQADSFEDGNGCFGYFVKQPSGNASEKHLKLEKACGTRGTDIAWLGFEFSADGKTQRAVWFYFDSETARHSLKEKLRKQFASVELKPDPPYYCVSVASPLNQSLNDFAWFQSVVDCAIAN